MLALLAVICAVCSPASEAGVTDPVCTVTSGAAISDPLCIRSSGAAIPDLFCALSEASSGELPAFEYTQLMRLPKRYSLAEEGKKPAVRSQGALGTCWAISACSAIESALLPRKTDVYSPDHMSLHSGFDIRQDEGGDYYMIMSYLADWKGPVKEEDDPYGDGISPEGLPAAVHVQDIRLLRGMTQRQIKQMILTYGAAQSSLSMTRRTCDASGEFHYYNADTASYYDPFVEELNHDILVLGWDDSYPRGNFRIRPQHDGAWICQNTWGEDFGEDGIFYVSYEDRNLFRKGGIVYDRIAEAEETGRVYEQDLLGWQGRQGYGSEQCWFAGVFCADRDETAEGIGFYTTAPYTAYRIFLVPEFTGAGDLEAAFGQDGADRVSGSADVRMIAAGQIAHPGFHTVSIPGEVRLREGQTWAAAVWIDTPGAANPVAVEKARDRYTRSVTTEGKETYLSRDGTRWENTQEAYETNVCLKVFTSAGSALRAETGEEQ